MMRRILFNRWAKSSSFTPDELHVLENLLPQRSEVAKKLLGQAERAPYVNRRIEDAGYEATIPYLEDDSLLVEANETIRSPSVEVIAPPSGRRLRFSTEVLRGGFLLGLRGATCDGKSWPRKWCIGSEIVQNDAVIGWLTALEIPLDAASVRNVLSSLAVWSGVDEGHISPNESKHIRLAPPATDTQLVECEVRLQTVLPDQYRQLVKIANGFGIHRGRPYEILGTSDIEYLDSSRHWLGITPLYEDGYVALRNEDRAATCYLLSPDGSSSRIGDLKNHIHESIKWET